MIPQNSIEVKDGRLSHPHQPKVNNQTGFSLFRGHQDSNSFGNSYKFNRTDLYKQSFFAKGRALPSQHLRDDVSSEKSLAFSVKSRAIQ